MDSLIAQLMAVFKRMWRYRWPGLIAAWLVGIVAAVVVFVVPDRFEASARVYVDTQSMLKPLMTNLAVLNNTEQQVSVLSRTLISRPNVEKLVRMADLDLRATSKSDQEALIDRVTRNLSIQSAGGTTNNLYILSYRDSSPEVSKKVVASLLNIFMESSLGASRKDSTTAATFLNEQIKNYEAKLEEAETRRKEFRLRNLQLTAQDGKDSAARLAEASAQLDTARLQLREAVSARDVAKQQLEMDNKRTTGGGSLQSLMQESAQKLATPEIDSRIEGLKRNLDALQQRYTDQHPDVVNTKRLIKDLEDQKKKEVAELQKAALNNPSAGGRGDSLVAQQLSLTLANKEQEVATLRTRVEELQGRYTQAQAAIKMAPQLEAEFSQLNRDYDVIKKNYEEMVARRESASLSTDLDNTSGVADFRIIDPPRASSKPVAPNRLMLLAAGLVVAVLAGLVTAFGASQVRPVFHDLSELRQRLEMPILGVVSRQETPEDRRRAKVDLLRFGAASGGLAGVYALGLIGMAIWLSRQVG
ncbi:XrtA system polysaccharide chain length determinant [Roseateles depolymerans]|uniref:Polysaccharide chain length determinant protein, PEP-CTERM locus subfamily n=1 Tax=Roseateles depolymerans TaxID=76731 RepID=A0A0U3MTI2_9BURK|nr:XrtA system polysaccharide chain length determinant [Roseateles depolymerans]ALV06291.1 Polysaccharide chain length determinant protein, PEP-CTERM locus subfamily [Roseateles depolymerans]REG19261.1 polysaccharide chain length determinant protein (PEP-CTERM system associated) [Roseateles depolymerans]